MAGNPLLKGKSEGVSASLPALFVSRLWSMFSASLGKRGLFSRGRPLPCARFAMTRPKEIGVQALRLRIKLIE